MTKKNDAVAVADEQLAIAIPPAARQPKIRNIDRLQIHPDPEQPRQAADAELRNSIARNGLLQPLTVRPHPEILTEWMIVDGERRWRSCEGVLESIPCIVRTDQEDRARRLATQLEANTALSLTPFEEAHAFRQILEDTGMSVADVADFLGRPKSTVAERLALLELGPWVPLLERGELTMSHAVKVLLPLRTAADVAHEHAIEFMRKDWRFQNKGGGQGISLGDFEHLMQQAYRSAMYPLTKTKSTWHTQPEFSTARHDAECNCGGVQFSLDHADAKRRCCANPEWWKPLHRKALAAKKADKPKSGPKGKALYLPEAAKVVASKYGQRPDGVTQLTNTRGEWETYGEDPFDPADLVIDDAKLVAWEQGHGRTDGYSFVGTRDAAAVKAARAKWAARWDAERAKLGAKLGAELKPHLRELRLEGAGLTTLGSLLGRDALEIALDVAEAAGVAVPAHVTKGERWQQEARTAKWIAGLTAESASTLLTAVAAVVEFKLKLPGERIEQLQQSALGNIRKRTIPWLTKPKAAAKKAAPAKKAKKAKLADREVPLGSLSTQTHELPLDEVPWREGEEVSV